MPVELQGPGVTAVVSGPVWVLGTRLRSSARAARGTLLSPEPLSSPLVASPICLFPPGLPRKQLQELSGQHQQELATQLAQFKVEMAEREERQQQVAQDYELRYWTWVPLAVGNAQIGDDKEWPFRR